MGSLVLVGGLWQAQRACRFQMRRRSLYMQGLPYNPQDRHREMSLLAARLGLGFPLAEHSEEQHGFQYCHLPAGGQ